MYIEGKGSGGTMAPSIMDSPHIGKSIQREETPSLICQSNTLTTHTIQKGLVWQQRDRLFSRWKERYFVLTQDYLNCFRKASDSGPDRISDMGTFLFKIKLVDVDRVEWVNKRSHSLIILHLTREGRLLLRAAHGLENWFENLEDCRVKSRKRREMLRMSHDSYIRDLENSDQMSSYNSGTEDWLLARTRLARMHRDHMTDSVADLPSMATSITTGSRSGDEDDRWPATARQRLSLLTNLDLNALDTPPPSVPPSLRGRTPCKLNSEVFFMAGRQRASIAGSVAPPGTASPAGFSFLRPRRGSETPSGSFRLPNMLHTTRGTANRYSYAEEKVSPETVYSTYDTRLRNVAPSPS